MVYFNFKYIYIYKSKIKQIGLGEPSPLRHLSGVWSMQFLRLHPKKSSFLPSRRSQTPLFFLLCTQSSNLCPPERPPASLSCLVERLPRTQSVVSAFQSWMAQGNPVHRGDIFHAVNRLRRLKMNKRALEVFFFSCCCNSRFHFSCFVLPTMLE